MNHQSQSLEAFHSDVSTVANTNGPHNRLLSYFLQQLNPETHSELILAIFKACPELVKWYWKNHSGKTLAMLNMNMNDGILWIISVLQLPVPSFANGQDVHVDSCVENSFPSVLTRTFVSKCMQNSDIWYLII